MAARRDLERQSPAYSVIFPARKPQYVGQGRIFPSQIQICRLKTSGSSRNAPPNAQSSRLLKDRAGSHRLGCQVEPPASQGFLLDGSAPIHQRERLFIRAAHEINPPAVHSDLVEPGGGFLLRRKRFLREGGGRGRQPVLNVPTTVRGAHQIQAGMRKGERAEFEVPMEEAPPPESRGHLLGPHKILLAEARALRNGNRLRFDPRAVEKTECEMTDFNRAPESGFQPRGEKSVSPPRAQAQGKAFARRCQEQHGRQSTQEPASPSRHGIRKFRRE